MVSTVRIAQHSQLCLFALYGAISWTAITAYCQYNEKLAARRAVAEWIISLPPEALAQIPI